MRGTQSPSAGRLCSAVADRSSWRCWLKPARGTSSIRKCRPAGAFHRNSLWPRRRGSRSARRDGAERRTREAGGMKRPIPPKAVKPQLCRVLTEDPDLAEALRPTHRSEATQHCLAPAIHLPRGRWEGPQADTTPGGIGLLVLCGPSRCRVTIQGGLGAELPGQGDLLRPWQRGKARSQRSRTRVAGA